VGGRRIVQDPLDDVYSPPKTVEQGQVAFMSTIGTPSNSAIYRCTNSRGMYLLPE
jgi:hypothetical protein